MKSSLIDSEFFELISIIFYNRFLTNSNEFIEFMLKIINEAVDGMILTSNQETTQETTQEKIINLIRKNPAITQVEMAKILNLTRDGISYNIKILKEKGIIERVGSTKNGSWKINVVE